MIRGYGLGSTLALPRPAAAAGLFGGKKAFPAERGALAAGWLTRQLQNRVILGWQTTGSSSWTHNTIQHQNNTILYLNLATFLDEM